MLKQASIYRKSPKGVEAIARRDPDLGPRRRPMLIIIDGKRTVDELSILGATLGNPGELLNQLLADGYIEEVDQTPSDTAVMSLQESQKFISKRLTRVMGPTGDSLCLRIERARNALELRDAVKRSALLLRDVRGSAVAAQFEEDIAPYLSAHAAS